LRDRRLASCSNPKSAASRMLSTEVKL
jgi:hypothetical protein